MRPLEELVDTQQPAIQLIQRWVAGAETHVEVLPPSADREAVLLAIQVTTHSLMGAIAYDTGGILVDDGWLRFPGSGHALLSRTLADWNAGRGDEYFLLADDAAGGFFGISRAELGRDEAIVHYWAPDNLAWEPLGFCFADFLQWSLTSWLAEFYQHLRWPSWKQDVVQIPVRHGSPGTRQNPIHLFPSRTHAPVHAIGSVYRLATLWVSVAGIGLGGRATDGRPPSA